jgi:hypothetical protein
MHRLQRIYLSKDSASKKPRDALVTYDNGRERAHAAEEETRAAGLPAYVEEKDDLNAHQQAALAEVEKKRAAHLLRQQKDELEGLYPKGSWYCSKCAKINFPTVTQCPGYVRGNTSAWIVCGGSQAETWGGYHVLPERVAPRRRNPARLRGHQTLKKRSRGDDETAAAEAAEKLREARTRRKEKNAEEVVRRTLEDPYKWACGRCQLDDGRDTLNGSERTVCYKCTKPRPQLGDPGSWRWSCPKCSSRYRTISGAHTHCECGRPRHRKDDWYNVPLGEPWTSAERAVLAADVPPPPWRKKRKRGGQRHRRPEAEGAEADDDREETKEEKGADGRTSAAGGACRSPFAHVSTTIVAVSAAASGVLLTGRGLWAVDGVLQAVVNNTVDVIDRTGRSVGTEIERAIPVVAGSMLVLLLVVLKVFVRRFWQPSAKARLMGTGQNPRGGP